MARPKSRKTRRIEHLKANNARLEGALRQQMADTNPFFEELSKLEHAREFVLSMVQLHFSLDEYTELAKAIRAILDHQIPTLPNANESDKCQLLETSRQFFDDAVMMRTMVERMKGKAEPKAEP